MGRKIVALLCLSLAILAMITSEVAAKDLAKETSASLDTTKETNGVNDFKYGYGKKCKYGCCRYRCKKCCPYAGQAVDADSHGRCKYGCCHFRCDKCCSYAGEAVNAGPEAKPHN